MRGYLSRPWVPAVLVALPLVAEAAKALTVASRIWFWGDQALIDIEARNSLLGRNLLGVYDQYGIWHHLGPIWLLLLGVFRWIGGQAPAAVVVGFCLIQAAAAAAIVIVAGRIRPGLTAWWAAVAVLGLEWSLGLERTAVVWAPYAIVLPAALLVLLAADVVSTDQPWPPTIGLAACATFLAQTDISTAIMVATVVVLTPVARWAVHLRCDPRSSREGGERRWSAPGWGWSAGNWRLGASATVLVLAVLWLPPAIQQFTSSPGNITAAYDFFTTHPPDQSTSQSLEAADTAMGIYPFHLDQPGASLDSTTSWLVTHSVIDDPWYLVYLIITAGSLAVAFWRRERTAFGLSFATLLALLAFGVSITRIYGPLFPYDVLWGSALAVPAWIAWWTTLGSFAAHRNHLRSRLRAVVERARLSSLLPLAGIGIASAVTAAFAVGAVPMAGAESLLGQQSWDAVATWVTAPYVRTVLVDSQTDAAFTYASAIADAAISRGRSVEFIPSAMFKVDPSMEDRGDAQLTVLVCSGPVPPQVSAKVVSTGNVNGFYIYVAPGDQQFPPC